MSTSIIKTFREHGADQGLRVRRIRIKKNKLEPEFTQSLVSFSSSKLAFLRTPSPMSNVAGSTTLGGSRAHICPWKPWPAHGQKHFQLLKGSSKFYRKQKFKKYIKQRRVAIHLRKAHFSDLPRAILLPGPQPFPHPAGAVSDSALPSKSLGVASSFPSRTSHVKEGATPDASLGKVNWVMVTPTTTYHRHSALACDPRDTSQANGWWACEAVDPATDTQLL